jgi:signal transduction histidine kinase
MRDVSDRTRVIVGRVMAAIGVVGSALGIWWFAANGLTEALFREWIIHNAAAAIGFGTITWLVLPKQPRNAAIWVTAWTALFGGLFVAANAWLFGWADSLGFSIEQIYRLSPSEVSRGFATAAMLVIWFYAPSILPLNLGLLLFPDGKPPSSRWRWAIWASILAVAISSVGQIWLSRPTSTVPYGTVQGTSDMLGQTGPVLTIGFMLELAMMLVGLTAMVVRFHRSTGIEQQQFRWVMWGGAVAVAVIAYSIIYGMTTGEDPRWPFLVALVSMITSYGIAIGKYRLYEIDVVISRSVVFAILAAFITLTYALIVVGIGQRLGGDSGEFLLPIAATGLVAVAFEPVRLRAQRWANRLVYGNRATPYEVLSEMTGRLSSAEEGDDLLQRIANLLRNGTGADEARVWVGEVGSMRVAASSEGDVSPLAQPSLDEETSFVVSHDEETVGILEVMKAKGSALSRQERALVSDLAGSAGAVLGYKRLNDSLAAKALELEQSRARLVGAQDQERRRLERELHEGAEQYIVALKVKLGVAAQLSAQQRAVELTTLLEGLTAEAQTALDDVQSLAKGIYPPILVSDGLGAAISALARATPVEVHIERDGIGRYPSDVEAAVYFDISEAVTNAVKHADAPIRIELSDEGGHLSFSVTDAGPGFDLDHSNPGSGLENMADRLAAVGGVFRVSSEKGRQTVISGEIPVRRLTPR